MNVIAGDRGTGRTTRLVRMLLDDPDLYLLVLDHAKVGHTLHLALELSEGPVEGLRQRVIAVSDITRPGWARMPWGARVAVDDWDALPSTSWQRLQVLQGSGELVVVARTSVRA